MGCGVLKRHKLAIHKRFLPRKFSTIRYGIGTELVRNWYMFTYTPVLPTHANELLNIQYNNNTTLLQYLDVVHLRYTELCLSFTVGFWSKVGEMGVGNREYPTAHVSINKLNRKCTESS